MIFVFSIPLKKATGSNFFSPTNLNIEKYDMYFTDCDGMILLL